jgi:GDP-D-mannose dehydratase
VVLYFLTAFVGIMVYQVSFSTSTGTASILHLYVCRLLDATLTTQTVDCAIYFAITSGVYVRAMMRGETMAERGGQAWSDA